MNNYWHFQQFSLQYLSIQCLSVTCTGSPFGTLGLSLAIIHRLFLELSVYIMCYTVVPNTYAIA